VSYLIRRCTSRTSPKRGMFKRGFQRRFVDPERDARAINALYGLHAMLTARERKK
jgi:hypothetical protein